MIEVHEAVSPYVQISSKNPAFHIFSLPSKAIQIVNPQLENHGPPLSRLAQW